MFKKLFLTQLASLLLLSSALADVFSDLDACKISCSQACAQLEGKLETALRDYKSSCGANPHPPNPRPPRSGSVEIYGSDSCSSNLIASISESTNCANLQSTGSSAWGVKVNGVCHNIDDMSVAKACNAFSSAGDRDSVEIYHSDSCSSSLIAFASPRTQCSKFSSTGSEAWGVKVNGVCNNIDDMSVAKACTLYGNGNIRNAIKIFHSDSCSASSLIATVARNTDCGTFPNTGSEAWGVEIKGVCQNITDTNVRDACERFKGSAL